MLYNILLAFMILVCALMVVVILLQRSEGGALGMGGGGAGGFMTARGAGNLLTRTTWILFGLFFACAVLLIIEGNRERHAATFESLKVAPLAPGAALPAAQPQAQRPAATPPAQTSAPDLGDLEAPTAKPAAPAARPVAPAKSPAESSAPAATH